MEAWRERLAPVGLLILRVGLGGMMLGAHGLGKLTGFAEKSATFGDPLGVGSATSLALAVFAEFFCSLAVVFGLATRLAAVPLVITMLVAAGIVHADDPWGRKEFPLLYAIGFATLIFTGPGKLSLDHLIAGRRGRATK